MALLPRRVAIARSEAVTTVKSEFCFLLCMRSATRKLTNFVLEPSLRSNDSAQARGRPAIRQCLNPKMTVQRPLRPNRSRAVPQQEVSVRRNNAKKRENKNVPRLQTGEKGVQNGGKQTVCEPTVILVSYS